jgi:hypothetical protein
LEKYILLALRGTAQVAAVTRVGQSPQSLAPLALRAAQEFVAAVKLRRPLADAFPGFSDMELPIRPLRRPWSFSGIRYFTTK